MATSGETFPTSPYVAECLICQETMKDHGVLSCVHTVCIHCLDNNNNNCANNKPNEEIECPLCSRMFLIPSDGIKNLTNNFFMNKLLEVNKLIGLSSFKKTTLCELCSDGEVKIPSTSFCVECNQHVCDRCSEMHGRIRLFKSHEIVRREQDVLSAEESIMSTVSYCDRHASDQKRLYCHDCKTLMCHKCVGRPNKHSLAEAKESRMKFREQLKVNIDKVSSYSSQKQDEIIQLETLKKSFREKIDSTRNEIQREYETLLALVETHKCQLMTELNRCRDKALKEIETRRAKIESESVIVERFKRYCLAMMNKEIACDMSCVARDLRTGAEELVKTRGEYDGRDELDGVEITFKPSLSTVDRINNFIGELVFTDTRRCEQRTNLVTFFENPQLLHVENSYKKPITGVTVLGGEFFVVRQSSQIYVYSCDTFRLNRVLEIAGSNNLKGIASCAHYSCLYVCHPISKTIYKYDVASNATSNWPPKLLCDTLSVNKTDHNVVATLFSTNTPRVQVYTTDGCLVRKIRLDVSICNPQHCVQLSDDTYAVSHWGPAKHRVCIVDQNGRIVRSFGERPGNGRGLLNRPRQLAVDVCGNVLVADFNNHRLQLLSPALVSLGVLEIPVHRLRDPFALCLDELNRRLYVGECGEGRVFVLGFNCNTVI